MNDDEFTEYFPVLDDAERFAMTKPTINRNVLCWQNLLASFVLWGMIFGVAYLFWWKAGQ